MLPTLSVSQGTLKDVTVFSSRPTTYFVSNSQALGYFSLGRHGEYHHSGGRSQRGTTDTYGMLRHSLEDTLRTTWPTRSIHESHSRGYLCRKQYTPCIKILTWVLLYPFTNIDRNFTEVTRRCVGFYRPSNESSGPHLYPVSLRVSVGRESAVVGHGVTPTHLPRGSKVVILFAMLFTFLSKRNWKNSGLPFNVRRTNPPLRIKHFGICYPSDQDD